MTTINIYQVKDPKKATVIERLVQANATMEYMNMAKKLWDADEYKKVCSFTLLESESFQELILYAKCQEHGVHFRHGDIAERKTSFLKQFVHGIWDQSLFSLM